ncbi:rab-GTPase-TBC domain-domain-containing protein [Coniella lustricola]|uniref:Rab-GTPase-TBC domain-domain-containing protein n=1 Tax=Coniella lustricola TaxID=2025994 RepID=A0A2T3A698_9PEZI|nr:rab-GTPase-TBC domain-domain-containing protein [Coniella lustricola]
MAEADSPPPVEDSAIMDEEHSGSNTAESRSTPVNSKHKVDGHPADEEVLLKKKAIRDACRRRDIQELESLAQSPAGFVTDELRQEAWPVLLGLPIRRQSEAGEKAHEAYLDTEDVSWKRLPPHKDEGQVQLDVDRAFVYYPDCECRDPFIKIPTTISSVNKNPVLNNNVTSDQNDDERTKQKTALSNVILSVLRRNPYLHYFQGYHDIAQVFLLVLPAALRGPAVSRLSTLRIRDFMLPNLTAAIAQLRLIPAILYAADPPLWAHLSQTEPFFALSGTLTMYAHDVQSLGEITRLFDVLLAREPVFSVYMFAQIVLGRRTELFDTPPSEPEMLHSILSKLPQPLDLEALITATARLYERHPPESLPGSAWSSGISEFSVLKTARQTADCAGQSEAVGAYYFAEHVRDLERRERRARVVKTLWAYSKPAGAVGFAVLFGILAYWMRRSTVFGAGGGVAGGGGHTGSLSGVLAVPMRALQAVFSQWRGLVS